MAKKEKGKKSSKKTLKINFSGVDPEVKRGATRVKIPEGDYPVKIIDHTIQREDGDGKVQGIRWNCQIVRGPHKGKKLTGFTSIKPEALWSLRNLIHAATGKNVAGKALDLDPTKMYGKVVGAEVTDNEWKKNGQTRVSSQINTFFPEDEIGETDDEDEEDEEDEDEEDDDESDEEDDEDLEEVDVDEL